MTDSPQTEDLVRYEVRPGGFHLTGRPSVSDWKEDVAEKRQALWWYLLLGGLMLLAAETAISNHLSRKEKFL